MRGKMRTFTVTLDDDLDGARWLRDEAERLHYATKDSGWKDIAEQLTDQITRAETEDEEDR